MKKITVLSLLVLALVFVTTPVMAGSYTFYEDSWNAVVSGNGGQVVDSSAVFTTGAGSITIVLTNTLIDPKDVGQNLSDLGFYYTLIGAVPSGTLASSSALSRDVKSDGTYTDGSLVDTQWILSAIPGGLYLNGLGTPAPQSSNTIIGSPAVSGKYDSANASIAGNAPHNPFLAGPVTFNITAPGVTVDTVITGVWFSYGTTPSTPPPQVPEPTTLLLLGLGLIGIAGIGRSLKK